MNVRIRPMLTRRTILEAALLVPFARRAFATPAMPKLISPDVPILAKYIYSRTNDNSSFQLWIETDPFAEGAVPTLVFETQHWKIASTARDGSKSIILLDLDRDLAHRMARAWSIVAHERSRLDEGLRYTWSFPPKATTRADDPILIKLAVENTGKRTIGFLVGGRQRGPRDNRFSFAVSRNGTPLPVLPSDDFGGIAQYRNLGPGDKLEVSADLRAWFTIDQPGHYAIDAKHETELSKDALMPDGPSHQADVWDVAPVGQGAILVP